MQWDAARSPSKEGVRLPQAGNRTRIEIAHLVEAIELVIDENEFTPLQRKRLKKKVRKQAKQGKLSDLNLEPGWAWRICAASLCLGRLNGWWGWEARSQVMWDLCHVPWHYPRWDGSRCRLYLLAEQGVGDEIFFSNAYHDLLEKNPDTVIECDSRLIPAFTRTFQTTFSSRWKTPITKPSGETDSVPLVVHRGDFDAFMPCGNAVKLMVKKPQDFRQDWIVMDQDRVRWWRQYLEDFPRPWIGSSWVGRQGTLDPEIFQGPGTVFNLNYEGTQGFIKPPVADFDDEWHFIAALDRVDTVTNSVVHMAGSVGVPCNAIKAPAVYGAVNNRLQWQFGGMARHFYPKMRVFTTPGEYRKWRKDGKAEKAQIPDGRAGPKRD